MLPLKDALVVALFSVLFAVDVIGNSLLCYIILTSTQLKRHTRDLVVLNLSFADLLVGIFFFPRHVLRHAFRGLHQPYADWLCKFVTGGNVAWIAAAASSFSLVVLALERFYAVMYPFRQRFTLRKVKITVLTCWLYATLFMLPLFLVVEYDLNSGSCSEKWADLEAAGAFSTLTLVFLLIIPLLIMTILYGLVIHKLWFKSSTQTIQPTQLAVEKTRKTVTKMLLIVTVIYVVCWSSDLILYMLLASQWNSNDPIYSLPEALVLLNSSVNPIIFTIYSQRFRQSLRRVYQRKQRKNSIGVLGSDGDKGHHRNSADTRPVPRMELSIQTLSNREVVNCERITNANESAAHKTCEAGQENEQNCELEEVKL